MKNFSFKQAFSCAATEFVKWVCDARMVIVAVLLIFINNFAVSPLTNNAELMGEPLNILEPFIAVANSEILILIIPIVFLTLIADYPKVDTNTVFYIVRIGRANWFVGQVLKLVFMIVSYLAVIFLGTVLPMLSKGFWYNGWSNVATGFVKMFPDRRGDFGVELLPENLYNQLSVFEAAVKSYLLVAAYLMIIGLILLVFSLFKRKTLGFIIGLYHMRRNDIPWNGVQCYKDKSYVDNANGKLNNLAALHEIFQKANNADELFCDLSASTYCGSAGFRRDSHW